MAKFTASVPLNIRWFGNEIAGAAGATHRIPDALYDEFNGAYAGVIPGLTWVEDDEIGQINTDGLTAKYDKTGGTISGAVVATGAITGASLSATGAITGASIVGTTVSATTLSADNAIFKGSPHINAKAYGATGDGVTDDTTALQNSINALTTGLNATLFIPAGTYVVSTSLLIPYMQYNRILGAGPNATILQATMTNSPIIKTQEENTQTIEIADLGLWYATQRVAANTSAMGIMFAVTSAGVGSGFYHWRVSNVGINRAGVGIGTDPGGSGSIVVWGSLFDRIVMTAIAYRGVSMAPISGGMTHQTWVDIKINNNNTGVVATNYAFFASAVELSITGLNVEGWRGQVFYNDGGLPATVRGIHVENHTATASLNLIEIANGFLGLSGVLADFVVQSGAAVTVCRVGDGGSLTLDGARIDATVTSGSVIGASAHSSARGINLRNIVDVGNNVSIGRLGQMFVGSVPPWLTNGATNDPLANQALLYAFEVESTIRVSRAGVNVGTASGSADLGIYDANGTRLASTGAFALSPGSITAALTTSLLLNPGQRYYAAIAANNTTATFSEFTSATPSASGNQQLATRVDSSFPLPATIAIGTTVAQRMYSLTFEP